MGRIFPFKCIDAAILVRKKFDGEKKLLYVEENWWLVIDKIKYITMIIFPICRWKKILIILNNWRFNTKKKE